MPCSCGTAAGLDAGESTSAGCGCDTGSACDCGSPEAKSGREVSLERVVMELDMRVRKLESQLVEASR
jgi:hypothetical protein